MLSDVSVSKDARESRMARLAAAAHTRETVSTCCQTCGGISPAWRHYAVSGYTDAAHEVPYELYDHETCHGRWGPCGLLLGSAL